MRRVISASRLVRNMGAVPLFGFTRAKSDGASGKQRSGFSMVRVSWRKKAHSVSSNRRSVPPNIRAQNLNRESTSGKKGGSPVPSRLFSKSNRPPTRPLVEMDLKKAAAVLSAYMPDGVRSPTNPSSLINPMARSTNSE